MRVEACNVNWLTTRISPSVCTTSRFIVEDTQAHEFSGEVLDVLVGVVAPDAEQHQQSRPDPGADIAADSDGSVFYTLNEQSHGRDIQRFSK